MGPVVGEDSDGGRQSGDGTRPFPFPPSETGLGPSKPSLDSTGTETLPARGGVCRIRVTSHLGPCTTGSRHLVKSGLVLVLRVLRVFLRPGDRRVREGRTRLDEPTSQGLPGNFGPERGPDTSVASDEEGDKHNRRQRSPVQDGGRTPSCRWSPFITVEGFLTVKNTKFL